MQCPVSNVILESREVTDHADCFYYAPGYAAAIDHYDAGDLKVIKSVFQDNNDSQGATLSVGGKVGKVRVRGSAFHSNSGGALLFESLPADTDVRVRNSTFTDNQGSYGGAIRVANSK